MPSEAEPVPLPQPVQTREDGKGLLQQGERLVGKQLRSFHMSWPSSKQFILLQKTEAFRTPYFFL